ncbi:MAG: hypothetical protein E6Q97_06520 [Desulfurellales bacterium]|nr:MAG: hypothetical protein E6Q97_06520 [Desulfurellales bacterium]
MRVQFLVDFRGKLTRENYYLAGQVVEFEPAIAQALIDEGRAVRVVLPAPEPAPASPKPAPRKRQTSGGVL